MTGGSDLERRARFERVVEEVLEPVRRYLARRTDRDTADDALADTLLVCWRRLDEMPAEVLPWTYGVARLALANAERGGRRQRRLAARITVVDPPRETTPDVAEPDPRVARALGELRPEEAELLRLWALEHLGPSEIATILDITPNAVSIRLHRSREKFKQVWRKITDDAGHEEADRAERADRHSTEGRQP